MTPVFGSRRRADEFDLLLARSERDRTAGGAPTGQHAELLDLVAALRSTPAPSPRAAFSADLRERLMLAADEALTPTPVEPADVRRAPAVRRSARERRLVTAVGGFAIVSATASMAVAAQSALPGDTLYPLKRAIENAQAGAQGAADDKGSTLLGNAAGRLDEVDALSRDGRDDDATTIATTLDDFVQQASEASDLLLRDYSSTGHASSIEELRSFTADSMGALTTLQGLIPKDARSSLIQATQVINAIDVQAQSLCPACTDLPIMQAPQFASQAVETLLDDALAPVLDSLLPPADPSSTGAGKGTRKGAAAGGKGGPRASGEARGDGSDVPVSPPATVLPPPVAPAQQGTGDSGAQGKGGDKKRDGGLLDDLTVKGGDDPIGDLLTGTGDVVEDLVDGLGQGLGGLGQGLGGLGKN